MGVHAHVYTMYVHYVCMHWSIPVYAHYVHLYMYIHAHVQCTCRYMIGHHSVYIASVCMLLSVATQFFCSSACYIH